jgi:hypothetical protein
LAAILLALAAILLPTSLLVLPRIGLHSQDHQFAKSAYPPRARARRKAKWRSPFRVNATRVC